MMSSHNSDISQESFPLVLRFPTANKSIICHDLKKKIFIKFPLFNVKLVTGFTCLQKEIIFFNLEKKKSERERKKKKAGCVEASALQSQMQNCCRPNVKRSDRTHCCCAPRRMYQNRVLLPELCTRGQDYISYEDGNSILEQAKPLLSAALL